MPQNVCRYFLAGNCQYGKRCKFDHVKPKASKKPEATPSTRGKRIIPAHDTPTNPDLQVVSAVQPFIPGVPWAPPSSSTVASGLAAPAFAPHSPGTWANVAGSFTPGVPEGKSTMDPTDEEMLWLEEQMAALDGEGSVDSSGIAQGGSDVDGASIDIPSGLTAEEWADIQEAMMEMQIQMGVMGDVESGVTGESSISQDAIIATATAQTAPAPSPAVTLTADESAWLTDQLEGDDLPSGGMLSGPTVPKPSAVALAASAPDSRESLKSDAELHEASKGLDCDICVEEVLANPDPKLRRFALLSNCDHVFCTGCIQRWRKSNDAKTSMVRECPICRVTSYFFVPSRFHAKGADRLRILEEYKTKCAQTHCMHFRRGEGDCPFGSSCFYRHELPDGSLADERPRYIASADGEAVPMQSVRISDFLDAREAAVTRTLSEGGGGSPQQNGLA